MQPWSAERVLSHLVRPRVRLLHPNYLGPNLGTLASSCSRVPMILGNGYEGKGAKMNILLLLLFFFTFGIVSKGSAHTSTCVYMPYTIPFLQAEMR